MKVERPPASDASLSEIFRIHWVIRVDDRSHEGQNDHNHPLGVSVQLVGTMEIEGLWVDQLSCIW